MIQSIHLSVCPSVRPFLVTTEPIGFCSSGNIPIGPVVVVGYYIGGWDTPNPPKNKKEMIKRLKRKRYGEFIINGLQRQNVFF